MTQAQHDIARKLRILNYAKQLGNVSQACRYFAISKEKMQVSKEDSVDRASSREDAPAVKTVARRFPASGLPG